MDHRGLSIPDPWLFKTLAQVVWNLGVRRREAFVDIRSIKGNEPLPAAPPRVARLSIACSVVCVFHV